MATFVRIVFLLSLLTVSASPALAHVGVGGVSGFEHGFLHPLAGLDHVLAMVAVGLFAAHLGGLAFWLVPGSFVLMMAIGGALGVAGVEVPWVEAGIAGSVIALGILLATQVRMSIAAAMALVGFFAVFHGRAHGAEMPVDAPWMTYAMGFVLATALLHALGMAVGSGAERLTRMPAGRIAQIGGGAIAVVGAGLAAGIV